MFIESVSPIILDIHPEIQKKELLLAIQLPFVIDPPRDLSRLRGERFENIIVKSDPKDNIHYSKWRWVGKAIKWIWHVLIEETVRVVVEKGINEGLDAVNEEDDPDKPEETEKEEPPAETESTPEVEKEEEIPDSPSEPEWI